MLRIGEKLFQSYLLVKKKIINDSKGAAVMFTLKGMKIICFSVEIILFNMR